MGYQTLVRKAFLHGATPRIQFQIVDENGLGFKPDTLTLSIYDQVCTTTGATGTVVNSRDDISVLASCDASGNLEMTLDTGDTTVDVPEFCIPVTVQRRLLFAWTWDTTKVGKHEIVLTIAPDRETVAS